MKQLITKTSFFTQTAGGETKAQQKWLIASLTKHRSEDEKTTEKKYAENSLNKKY